MSATFPPCVANSSAAADVVSEVLVTLQVADEKGNLERVLFTGFMSDT